MIITDQVFNQAELLVGETDPAGRELLRLLCGAAVNGLSTQLREEITPEDCREDCVAAASLCALSEWYRGRNGEAVQEFHAGDLTVKQGPGAALSPESLKAQAMELLRPYRKDSFRFLGV